jgi:hypothetical protein
MFGMVDCLLWNSYKSKKRQTPGTRVYSGFAFSVTIPLEG